MNPFHGRHFQGEIILWAVRWYCKYGISYRELVIAPVKTDTSQLRPSHSTRVKECSMERIEVITSVQRRRRYSGQEKAQFVAMTMQPGSSVPSVARQYGISPRLLFKWKRLMQDGGVTAVETNA